MIPQFSYITPLKHHEINYDAIKIAVCTWNLVETIPPTNSSKKLMDVLTHQLFGHDIPDLILFGTQECERSLNTSLLCPDKPKWENMLRQCAQQYKLVGSSALSGLHNAVLVKRQLAEFYHCIQIKKHRAGFCNMLGNKGALSILFVFLGQKFQFINCHLAAHQNENERRNEVLLTISQSIAEQDYRTQVFISGDLNYRIDMEWQDYEKLIDRRLNTQQQIHYTQNYQARDQLIREQIVRDRFLPVYHESRITFPPTYKLGLFSNQYNRERIPGWTDRIFVRKSRTKQICYGSLPDLPGSDHRPVFGAFEIQACKGLAVSYNDLGPRSSCQLM